MQVHFSLPFGKYWALEFTAEKGNAHKEWQTLTSKISCEGGVESKGHERESDLVINEIRFCKSLGEEDTNAGKWDRMDKTSPL